MMAKFIRSLAALMAAFHLCLVVADAVSYGSFNAPHFNTMCWALVCALGYGKDLSRW